MCALIGTSKEWVTKNWVVVNWSHNKLRAMFLVLLFLQIICLWYLFYSLTCLGTVLFPWYLLCRANYNSKQLDCQTVRQAQSFKLTNIFVGGHSITTIRADYFCLCYFCQTRKKRNDRTHTTNNGWDICCVTGYFNLPCM